MRLLMSAIMGLFFLTGFVDYAQAEEKTQLVPVIEVEKATYEFNQVTQGEIVKHDFRVFNLGSAILEIKKVKPG